LLDWLSSPSTDCPFHILNQLSKQNEITIISNLSFISSSFNVQLIIIHLHLCHGQIYYFKAIHRYALELSSKTLFNKLCLPYNNLYYQTFKDLRYVSHNQPTYMANYQFFLQKVPLAITIFKTKIIVYNVSA
jgi:hypothetical protein